RPFAEEMPGGRPGCWRSICASVPAPGGRVRPGRSEEHTMRLQRTTVAGRLVLAVSAAMVSASAIAGCSAGWGRGLDAGQEARGYWSMRVTAMTRDGALDLKARPWWPQAAGLKLNEQFAVNVEGAPPDAMLVRREQVTTRSGKVL